MNIYARKQRWKYLLVAIALVIVGVSLWYSNRLAHDIADNERNQVSLWAGAIRKKAKLVNYTNQLFVKLGNEERKKVELWKDATEVLANADFNTDFSFVSKVVENNNNVPVILTDEDDNIISSRNLNPQKSRDSSYLSQQLAEMKASYPGIEIKIFGNKKNFLYYKDSKLFTELKQTFTDLETSFINEIVTNTASTPVIYTDSTHRKVLAFGNIDSLLMQDSVQVKQLMKLMSSENNPIRVDLGEGNVHYIYYQNSLLLTRLKYFPIAQLIVIGFFILIAYLMFSSSRNAEQNQVWAGMAKETAHQLGTPLSSLMAWVEYLKDSGIDESTAIELDKDINRLNTVADRFSKIGSQPKLTAGNLYDALLHSVSYLDKRSSNKVRIVVHKPGHQLFAKLNQPLFEWVIENLCKNAIDAMEGQGSIDIYSGLLVPGQIYIDVIDTGKGISRRKFKTVFKPGYTTKLRGWGLGLSLTKRIIKDYHKGNIFVKHSEPDKGTTFRILLKAVSEERIKSA